MLRALDFHGFANIEFKRDPRDGQYKIIEVNARHNLSALLAVRCGVNFPLLQYRHLVHGELPDQPQCRQGVYWIVSSFCFLFMLRCSVYFSSCLFF